MPQVIFTEGAVRGLERCRKFLATEHPSAARRAAEAIDWHFQLLASNPDMGRPFRELRELVIGFGSAGYVLAFRHQKEAGY